MSMAGAGVNAIFVAGAGAAAGTGVTAVVFAARAGVTANAEVASKQARRGAFIMLS